MNLDLPPTRCHSQWQLAPGLILDARLAAFLESTSQLVVADLHLGYAWAHRQGGQLLPIGIKDDTLPRLHTLVDDFHPRELVLLGDIVHRAVPLPALKDELCRVFSEIEARCELRLIPGNHDRSLAALLRECGIHTPLAPSLRAGSFLLLHGDIPPVLDSGGPPLWTIIGHEHPALNISDGVATSAKVPCFAAGDGVLVLPAFSPWAAGTNIRTHSFQSPILRGRTLTEAFAVLNGKLVPVRVAAGYSGEGRNRRR
jgi:putative SbcD/Mre11-related phosphoesterase